MTTPISTKELVERVVESNLLGQILHTCDLASGSNVNKCRYASLAFFEDDLPQIVKEAETLSKQLEVARRALEFCKKEHDSTNIAECMDTEMMRIKVKEALSTIRSLSSDET